MSQTLNIGLVAYSIDDTHVFVRVPNERARWMLVERCVVEVDCPDCASIAGEPCQRAHRWRSPGDRDYGQREATRTGSYHQAVHVCRRNAWRTKRGTYQATPSQGPKPRIRISAAELQAMYAAPPADIVEPEGLEVDVQISLRGKDPDHQP